MLFLNYGCLKSKIINKNETIEKEPATESDWYKETKANWTSGTEIRTQRQKRGWTQKELGERIGASKQVISDLENNHRSVSTKKQKPWEIFSKETIEYFYKGTKW